MPLLLRRVRGNSAEGQEAGRRVSRAKKWAELQARRNGRYEKIELDPIWTDERQRRTYGNGERNFYVSYGVLTEFVRMNVILTYFATETATATDTERWKSGISASWRAVLVSRAATKCLFPFFQYNSCFRQSLKTVSFARWDQSEVWLWILLLSGAGTNLNLGVSGLAQSTGKNCWSRSPLFFGSESTASGFGQRFRHGQYSLVSFLFCCSSTHGAPLPSHL